jgi:hypothetical protein
MNKAKTVEDFISKEDCDYLVNLAETTDMWEGGGNEFWDGRVINYTTILKHDRYAAEIMLDANIRCKSFIDSTFDCEDPVYSDTLQMIRWFPGMEQHPHADDMTNTDIKGFEHRVFGSIIYLNNNYDGGHTFYPNFDFEIIPEKGKLAVHPGDAEHLHGVTKITGGLRYTIASFWTHDKGKSYDWPIH